MGETIQRLRAQKIEIDLPSEKGEIWVHATVQRVFKDKDTREVQQVIDRVDHVYRQASIFATETLTIQHPVTGEEIEVSGALAAETVRVFVRKWMQEKFGGIIDENGELIVDA